MNVIEVLVIPPTKRQLPELISNIVYRGDLGYLWKEESVICGIVALASYPLLTRDADWNSFLSERFSLVSKPSVLVIGKVVDIEMAVHVLDIHFVARELSLLSLQQTAP